jgi:hypothetical protein
MNTCPYCKEAIQDEAIKCPHCQSMLVPDQAQQPAGKGHEVVYVLDRGLVSFGKFAAAVLAIFIVFGVYVFGFDLNELVKKMEATEDKIETVTAEMDAARLLMETAQKDLDETQAEIATARAEIESQRKAVQGVKDEALMLLAEARRQAAAIRSQRETVDLMVVEYRRSLSGDPELRVQTVNVEQTENAGTLVVNPRKRGKLWPIGATLKIRFLDGEAELWAGVKAIALEWTRYANINLEFGTWETAEIRVSFEESGSWAYVGTDALNIPDGRPTMNLGILAPQVSREEMAPFVYRQFGHALGLLNEHQNPNATFEWDREAVQASFEYMSETQLEFMLFRKWPDGSFPIDKPFDPQSIMMYRIEDEWTQGDFSAAFTTTLSEMDKQFIAQLYPF